MAPPGLHTMGTHLEGGGARSPSKTRWSIPKVSHHWALGEGNMLEKSIPKKWEKNKVALSNFNVCFFFCLFVSFHFAAENMSSVQIHAEVHKSLDSFASCLAKAIESDAKLALFEQSLAPQGGLFMTRGVQKPRYLDGQRLRLESIDEGIVKDDREEEEEVDVEEKLI